jgi:hypothetical protein
LAETRAADVLPDKLQTILDACSGATVEVRPRKLLLPTSMPRCLALAELMAFSHYCRLEVVEDRTLSIRPRRRALTDEAELTIRGELP